MAIPGFRPSLFYAYNWKGAPAYNPDDVPAPLELLGGVDRNVLVQQLAYEWLGYGAHNAWSNPPFMLSSGGVVHPSLRTDDGRKPRILRGFIRRASFDTADLVSRARLYFMYNPEQITRDYVSYLDQGALDPFNTVYEAGNLVAPPSFMDFSFSLLFDRQAESVAVNDHPGVLVDYEFFDLVVRNVVPQGSHHTNGGQTVNLPDNGVMMVNPRDITVVFSPTLTVQGRPTNARVSFTKFSHRMTPIRMEISLTMRAVYLGPERDQTEYKAEQLQAEAAIPWNERQVDRFELKYRDLDNFFSSVPIDQLKQSALDAINNNTDAGNSQVSGQALDAVQAAVTQNATIYDPSKPRQFPGSPNSGANQPVLRADGRVADTGGGGGSSCISSTMCWRGFDLVNQAKPIGWPDWATVAQMINTWELTGWRTGMKLWVANTSVESGRELVRKRLKDCTRGDLLFSHLVPGKPARAAFFVGMSGDDKVKLYSADETAVGERLWDVDSVIKTFNYGVRAGSVAVSGPNTSYPNHPPPPASDIGAGTGVIQIGQTVVVECGIDTPDSPPTIRLNPAAEGAWKAWRSAWAAAGGPSAGAIPCTSGWRDPVQQQRNYEQDPNRFAPAASSYHCKGLAVDVDNNWLGALSQDLKDKLRIAARQCGWGQPRYRSSSGIVPPYLAGCNPQNGTKTDEPWHFSWGGCG